MPGFSRRYVGDPVIHDLRDVSGDEAHHALSPREVNPGSVIIATAGIMHMVVMPKLSGYLGLGIMLYLYIFAGAWLFSKAEHMRFITLGFAAMTLQISNDQVYSFYDVANLLIAYQGSVHSLVADASCTGFISTRGRRTTPTASLHGLVPLSR